MSKVEKAKPNPDPTAEEKPLIGVGVGVGPAGGAGLALHPAATITTPESADRPAGTVPVGGIAKDCIMPQPGDGSGENPFTPHEDEVEIELRCVGATAPPNGGAPSAAVAAED
jgi:hypothetical protein